jgi:hypothetical protein
MKKLIIYKVGSEHYPASQADIDLIRQQIEEMASAFTGDGCESAHLVTHHAVTVQEIDIPTDPSGNINMSVISIVGNDKQSSDDAVKINFPEAADDLIEKIKNQITQAIDRGIKSSVESSDGTEMNLDVLIKSLREGRNGVKKAIERLGRKDT